MSEAELREAELREAVEWITDRSPDWDERNMVAVQRFNLAIAELARLRAVEAAARLVVAEDTATCLCHECHGGRMAELRAALGK